MNKKKVDISGLDGSEVLAALINSTRSLERNSGISVQAVIDQLRGVE